MLRPGQLVTFATLTVVNVTGSVGRICGVTFAPLTVVNVTGGGLGGPRVTLYRPR